MFGLIGGCLVAEEARAPPPRVCAYSPWEILCPWLGIALSLVGKWLVPAWEFFVPAWEFGVCSAAECFLLLGVVVGLSCGLLVGRFLSGIGGVCARCPIQNEGKTIHGDFR